MPKRLKLEIVTPQRQVLTQAVQQVILPGVEGSFGVLPGHIPLVAALKPGMLRILDEKAEIIYALGGGYAEILSDHVIVLADTAERAEEIDIEAAQRERNRALAQLKQGVRGAEIEVIEVSLQKALARLQVVEVLRKRRK